ncbi:hypothetical protein BV96_02138 [Sphingomonas paucimobilis]|nr:hypothetical protein BV96_02138 [Sphingomonas paucimobilis]
MRPWFELLDTLFARNRWYLGDAFSVFDLYLNWIWYRSTGAGFEGVSYPHFARHAADVEANPSVQAMLALESRCEAALAQAGFMFRPQFDAAAAGLANPR